MEKCILIINNKKEQEEFYEYAKKVNYEVMGCIHFEDFLANNILLRILKQYHITNILCDETIYMQLCIKAMDTLGFKIHPLSSRVKLMYIFKADAELEPLKKIDKFIKDIDISKVKDIYVYGIDNVSKVSIDIYKDIIDIAQTDNIKTIYLSDSDFKFDSYFSYFVNRCILNGIQLIVYNESNH